MPKKAYECGSCNQVHEFYHLAESCCQPEINDVWLCGVCDRAHDDEEDADACCVGKVKAIGDEAVQCPCCMRDHVLVQLAVEIEVAGHCSECNPHFSVDETFKIADLVDQRVEDRISNAGY